MTKSVPIAFAVVISLGVTHIRAQEPTMGTDSMVVPRLISFAGTVRDPDPHTRVGVVGITFAIYEEKEGGSPLWIETQNVFLDEGRRYQVFLGSTKAEGLPPEIFISGKAKWLGISIENQPEAERILLASVPYAIRALEAERLAGRSIDEFVLVNKEAQLESSREDSLALESSGASAASTVINTETGEFAELDCTSEPSAPQSNAVRLYCLDGDERVYYKDSNNTVIGSLAALNQPQSWTAKQTFTDANSVRFADAFDGADAGAKIAKCLAALPATGGTCDARGLEGAQTIATNFLSGVSNPITILFGETVFTVSGGVTITVGSHQHLVGLGHGRTVFKFNNPGAEPGFFVNCDNCILEGFTVDMQSLGAGSAFHFVTFLRSALNDLEATNAGGHGFFFAGQGNGQAVHRSTAKRIIALGNAGHGWYVMNSQPGFGHGPFTIEDMNAFGNGGDGIRDESFDGVTRNSKNVYLNARALFNRGDGVELVGSGDVTFIGLETEINFGWGVKTTAVGDQKVDGVYIWQLGLTGNLAGHVDDSGAQDFYIQKSFESPEWDRLVLGRPANDTDFTRLILREGTSQTADILQFQAANTVVRTRFTKEGYWKGGDVAPSVVAGDADRPSFNIRRLAGQLGDYLQILDEYGAPLTTKIDSSERLTIPSINVEGQFNLPAGASLPTSCAASRTLFVDTSIAAEGQQLYLCNSAGNGWNLVGNGGTASGGYVTVEDEGTSLPQRATLNFTGPGVSCADDTSSTTCTIGDSGTDGAPVIGQFEYFFFEQKSDLSAGLDVPGVYINRSRGITITEVYCEVDKHSASINLQSIAGGSGGVLQSDLTCWPSGAISRDFVPGGDKVAVGDRLDHVTVSIARGVRRLAVVVTYTVD